jgi:hypothetical protein
MREDHRDQSEAVQRELYEAVLERAERAMESSESRSFYLILADTRIRLDFAGPALWKACTAALRHLEIRNGCLEPTDVVLKIWDSANTGVENVRPPWRSTDYSDRGDIWGFNSKRYLSAFQWGDYGLSLLDACNGTGIYWTQDAANLPYWFKAAPLRTLFHWLMQSRGLQLMHAAAFGTTEGAILVTGRGGLGKSSAALSCLRAGMRFIGDDYLVVGLHPEPTAYSLYSTAKIAWEQLEYFPELRVAVLSGAGPDDDKATLDLQTHFPRQICPRLPLRLVVTPRFHEGAYSGLGPVTLELLRGAATLTTVSQLPHGGQAAYRFVQDMIGRVPAATLLLGRDRSRVPAAVAEALRSPQPNSAANSTALVEKRNLPLISVIVPVFNGAHFLEEAFANILGQEYPSLEIIVVDDGSTDDLQATVRNLRTEVRFMRQANRGPGAARNLGIKNAEGDFLAFLDVDDLWPERTLPTLARYLLDNPDVQVARGRAQLMHRDGQSHVYTVVGSPLETFPDSIAAALFRKPVFSAVGLFDQTYHYGEDSEWFDRLRALQLEMHTLDLVTLYVRRHGANMTEGKNLSALHKLQLLKKHLDRRRAHE